jgi:hypothetical protein
MNLLLLKFKPAVSKIWLLAAAGLMWSAVGIMLCRLAYQWLLSVSYLWEFIDAIAGLLLAVTLYYFGFSRIAKKNIQRLILYPDKACFFAFQAWRSYLVIVVMILLGVFLRHAPVPKYYLSILYIAIGGALLLSSIHYYVWIWRLARDKNLQGDVQPENVRTDGLN